MGDKVNVWIDNLKSVLNRFIELPVFSILMILLGTFALAWLILFFIQRKRKSKGKYKLVLGGLFIISFFIVFGIFLDKKLNRISFSMQQIDYKHFNLQNEVGNVEFQLRANGLYEKSDSINQNIRPKLYNLDTLKKDYRKHFLISEITLNEATDLITLRIFDPFASIYIAVVDLKNPNLKVALTPKIREKYLTSEFAKNQNCFLAINGEAGKTPWQGCPLAQWTGNFIVDGNPLLLEDSKDRPFLSFDKNLKPTYFPEAILDTTNSPEKYNTIWGRYDILLNGKIVNFEDDYEYPRTIMGINQAKDKLYLMIVDGSQPGYSMGLTYKYCAELMQLLGAYNAMACDQGGSSCMYVEKMGGIINRPRDGQERFVYTHFGLILEEE